MLWQCVRDGDRSTLLGARTHSLTNLLTLASHTRSLASLSGTAEPKTQECNDRGSPPANATRGYVPILSTTQSSGRGGIGAQASGGCGCGTRANGNHHDLKFPWRHAHTNARTGRCWYMVSCYDAFIHTTYILLLVFCYCWLNPLGGLGERKRIWLSVAISRQFIVEYSFFYFAKSTTLARGSITVDSAKLHVGTSPHLSF